MFLLPKKRKPDVHSRLEEILHTASHGIGIVLGIVALVFLAIRAARQGGALEVTAVTIFAASVIVLYLASTIYHCSCALRARVQHFLEALDHSAIYVKIAGSYTPFALLTLSPRTGISLLVFVWVAAAIGIGLKIAGHFMTDLRKYDWISLASYLGLGWVAIFVVHELWVNLPTAGFLWLVAGGLSFTVGAFFYAWKSRAFTHTIFHVFVLGGSVCHFIAVYGYVLGNDLPKVAFA